MIPVSKQLNEAIGQFNKGNFGLWFNKFISLDDAPGKSFAKPSGKENALEIILKKYDRFITNRALLAAPLSRMHQSQEELLKYFSSKFIPLTFRARLVSRLITGLGQTHPTETGMVLEHNMGIPYIPAASVKGLVRAGRRLQLNLKDETKDKDEATLIPMLFGEQDRMGSVIFLDAFPETVPELEMDIMTPHYGEYYKDSNPEWPGDWMDPKPIKFLTVAKGTVFLFRALLDRKDNEKSNNTLYTSVKEAYETALTIEGVGAKTALGYGRFSLIDEVSSQSSSSEKKQQVKQDNSPDTQNVIFYEKPDGSKEYYLKRLAMKGLDDSKIQRLFQLWEGDKNFSKDKAIAEKFLPLIPKYKKKGNKETHFYKVIKQVLQID